MPGKTWCPHIRSSRCSVSLDDMLDFVEFAVAEYGRRVDSQRARATPDAEQSDVSENNGLDALEDAVGDFQIQQESNEMLLRFRLPDADELSIIRAEDGTVREYALRFGAYSADEYGKILLDKAFEHVTREYDLLADSERTLTITNGTYIPRIENMDNSRPLGEITQEIATLIQREEMIETRSHLS